MSTAKNFKMKMETFIINPNGIILIGKVIEGRLYPTDTIAIQAKNKIVFQTNEFRFEGLSPNRISFYEKGDTAVLLLSDISLFGKIKKGMHVLKI